MTQGLDSKVQTVADQTINTDGQANSYAGMGFDLLKQGRLETETGSASATWQKVAQKNVDLDECNVSSRIFAWSHTFDVGCKSGEKGSISQHIFSWSRSFTFADENGQTKATANARIFSWGTAIDVKDENGAVLGTIKENVFKSLFKPYTTYSIHDASGKEIATSKKVEWLQTNFEVHDSKGNWVSSINRPWINWLRDNWTISLNRSGDVDPRILMMIPAYKSAVDADRRSEEDDSGGGSSRRSK